MEYTVLLNGKINLITKSKETAIERYKELRRNAKFTVEVVEVK